MARAAAIGVLSIAISSVSEAQTKAPRPARDKVAAENQSSSPSKRSADQVEQELVALAKKMPRYSMPTMIDPQYRASMLKEMAPLLSKRVALLAEFEPVAGKDDQPMARSTRMRDQTLLCLWGDAPTVAVIEAAAADPDPARSTRAKVILTLKEAWSSGNDAAAQAKATDQLDAIAKEQPQSDDVAIALVALNGSAVDGDTAARTADIIGSIKSPTARKFNASATKVGKPMVITGAMPDGKTFTSKKWLGKVVMVDFWATWCPPCRQEIPETVALYRKFHDQGFEIVGVSSDNDKSELLKFVRSTPGMDWPQLFAGGRGWHPLTEKYGIQGIPRYFMIDRAGRLRTTEARGSLEEWVQRLLAEPVEAQAAAR